MPILAATNLSHSYGHSAILRGVSLSIEPEDRIGIVGRNGAGKTTLLKALTGQMKTDEGEVVLQRGSRAGYLEQDHAFNPNDTLRQAAEGGFAELYRLHHEQVEVFEKMAGAEGPRSKN